MSINLPWLTWWWSIHPVLWRVASINCILDAWATHGWILAVSNIAQATPVSNSTLSSHPSYVVLQFTLWLFDSQWTRFDNQVSVYSTQQAVATICRSVSGLSNYLEIRTFSIIFAKPSLMADTTLILVLPSFRSLWIFPMSVLSFSLNCWSRSEASQHLVWPFTPRLHMNAPKASLMPCSMHGMESLNAGHWIPEAWRVDCNSQVIE